MVVIVDSVEHIRGISHNEAEVQASVKMLFAGHADKLRIPDVHLIYTVPPYLTLRYPNLGDLYPTGAVYIFPAVKIREQAGRIHDDGVESLRRVLEARGDVKRLFGDDDLVREAILASGGHLRDLLRIVSGVLLSARNLPVDTHVVAGALNQIRTELLPIADEDAVWLARIASTHQASLTSPDDIPALARFLETRVVLCYRDGPLWYDVHPLIKPLVMKQAREIEQPSGNVHETPIVQGIVRLDSITLEDFCCMKALNITPQPPTGEQGQWIVLLGENGAGKSTVLRAIVLALAGPQVANAAVATYPAPLVRVGAHRARAVVVSGDRTFRIEIIDAPAGVTARADPNGTTARHFVFAYGAKRGSALGGPEPNRSDTRFSDVVTLFNEAIHLFPAITWLKARKLRAVQEHGVQEEIFAGVTDLLCELLPEVSAIEVFEDRVFAIAPRLGGRVPFAGLSDGYLTTAGWIVDMVARWLEWAERLKLPVDRRFYKSMEGLVLVDEVDQNLHPRWQRSIIKKLKDLFPRLSFVVTTHNPLTLLGTDPGEIQVLRWSEEQGHIEALPLDLPLGIRADQVLTGEWFGLASTVDDNTLDQIAQHQQMLLSGTPADAPERVALETELRNRLGNFADTALDRMALEVASELMQGRLRARSPKEREELRRKLKEQVQARLAEQSAQRDSSKD